MTTGYCDQIKFKNNFERYHTFTMDSSRQDIENVLNITAACHGLDFEQAAILNWRLLLSMRCRKGGIDFDDYKIEMYDDTSVYLAWEVLKAYGKGVEGRVVVSEAQDPNRGHYRSVVIVKALEIILKNKNVDRCADRGDLKQWVERVYSEILVPELERMQKDSSRDTMVELASNISKALYVTDNCEIRPRFWGIARGTVASMSLFHLLEQEENSDMACKGSTLYTLSDSVALILVSNFIKHASLAYAREMDDCSNRDPDLEEFLEFLRGDVQDAILKRVLEERNSVGYRVCDTSMQTDIWYTLMREIINSIILIKEGETLRGSLEHMWVTCR